MVTTSKKKSSTKKAVVKKTSKKKVAKKKSSSVKKKAEKKTTAKSRKKPGLAITAEERWRMIAVAAYHKAEKRKFTPGRELSDWIEAEKEIDRLLKG